MRTWRYVVPILVVALIGACGHQKTDATKASDALAAGLKAHAAGQLVTAAEKYHETLALDPNNKYAYFDLGVIDQSQGRAASAEGNYRTALGIDPKFTPALFNLAIIRTPTDPAEAISLYQQVIAVNPNDADAHLNLGFVLKSTGKTSEGDAELSRAVQIDPALQSRITPPQPTAAGTPSAPTTTRP